MQRSIIDSALEQRGSMKIAFTSPEHCQRLGASREGSRLVCFAVGVARGPVGPCRVRPSDKQASGALEKQGSRQRYPGKIIDADDAIAGCHQVRPLCGRPAVTQPMKPDCKGENEEA
jgi:hypothetical protein